MTSRLSVGIAFLMGLMSEKGLLGTYKGRMSREEHNLILLATQGT